MNGTALQHLSVCEGNLADDKQKVISLWQEGLHHPNAERAYNWLFVQNPVAKGTIYLLKVGDPDQPDECPETIGVIGTSPRRWKMAGQPIAASLFSDFVVTSAYRSLWPALKLIKQSVEAMTEEGVTIFGFPNKSAAAVLRRAGFTVVGDFFRYGKILHTKEKFAARMPVLLAAVLAPVADLALWADDWLCYQRYSGRMLGPASWQRNFDNRFDELALNSTMGDIVNHRGSDFLQWRFYAGPSSDYEIYAVTLASDQTRLAGYAVCRFEEGVAYVDDVYARDGERTGRAVFASLIRALRNRSVEAVSIEIMASPSFLRFLERLRFQKRESRQLFMSTLNEELNAQAGNGCRFFFTACDEDQ